MSRIISINSNSSPERAADILFVHGLNDNALRCWKPDPWNELEWWPHWVAREFPQTGVWLVDYEAPFSNWQGSAMTLPDRARNILEGLSSEPKLQGGTRPLIIIAHSLGGLVVKQMLRMALTLQNDDYKKIGEQVRGVVFLSTPHLGAQLVTLARNLDALGLARIGAAMNAMQDDDPHLRELNEWYRDNFQPLNIRTKVFLENKPQKLTRNVLGIGLAAKTVIVVDSKTGDPGLPGVGAIALDEDHLSMCKPETPRALVCNSVGKFLRDTLEGIHENVRGIKQNVESLPLKMNDGGFLSPRGSFKDVNKLFRPKLDSSLREPVRGAMLHDSLFYIERNADSEMQEALKRRDMLILVRGSREVGRSSLFVRGLEKARLSGYRVANIVLEDMELQQDTTEREFLYVLALLICEALNIPEEYAAPLKIADHPVMKMRQFLTKHVLQTNAHVVIALDEVEKLFGRTWSEALFGMMRGWHERKAQQPTEPWKHLSLLLSYSTEPSLFIKNPNQSPFNVGTRILMFDFNKKHIFDLNERYAEPLRNDSEIDRFFALLNGHPFLSRAGMDAMAFEGVTLESLEKEAEVGDGVYSDHLRHRLMRLEESPDLAQIVRQRLQGNFTGDDLSFYRLRRAGIMEGNSWRDMRLRCRLYEEYFKRTLND